MVFQGPASHAGLIPLPLEKAMGGKEAQRRPLSGSGVYGDLGPPHSLVGGREGTWKVGKAQTKLLSHPSSPLSPGVTLRPA